MKRRLIAAAAASFLVYLVPLVGPHAFWFLAEILSAGIAGTPVRHEAAWIAADWAVALVAQLLFGAICYWVFRKARRLPVLLLAGIVFLIALNWLYVIVIPRHFLIEPVTASEKTPWKQECVAPKASLVVLTASSQAALGGRAEALVRFDDLGWGVMRMPACKLERLPLPQNPNVNPVSVVPGATALASEWIDREASYRYWYTAVGTQAVLLDWLTTKASIDGTPILSLDGKWVARVVRLPGAPPTAAEVRIDAVDRSANRVVPLTKLGPNTYVLLSVDMQAGEVLLCFGARSFAIVGLDGGVRWGPFEPDPARADPQPGMLVRLADGWVAWDAYRDEQPYRIAWSLPPAQGGLQIPKGRSINGAAVRAGGDYIGYSVTCNISLGSAQDFVAAVRTSDSIEVFRKYLPRYTRTPVAFLGRDFFAYSDSEGGHSVVRVLRVQ